MKRRTSLGLVGALILSMAAILLGIGLIPFLVSQNPKYSISVEKNLLFSAFTFSPASCSLLSTIDNLFRCSSNDDWPIISRLSRYVRTSSIPLSN